MDAEQIIYKCFEILKERGKRYDSDRERKMDKTISIYNQISNRTLSVEDGYKLMISLKLARMFQSEYYEDDYIDLINYVALLAEYMSSKEND